ncbi:MAG: AhpC/TSA family protein, partial [Mesorhizobium sp.]
ITENETEWPHKLGMDAVMTMRIDLPGELPEPMNPAAAGDFLEKKDGYEITEADRQIMIAGHMPLIGEFLLDREGVVRWSFTEAEEEGQNVCRAPNLEELMSAASQVAH